MQHQHQQPLARHSSTNISFQATPLAAGRASGLEPAGAELHGCGAVTARVSMQAPGVAQGPAAQVAEAYAATGLTRRLRDGEVQVRARVRLHASVYAL